MLVLRSQVCKAAEMHAFPECRYVANGWQISTVAPNKGLADQVKKLILQTSDHVAGAPLQLTPSVPPAQGAVRRLVVSRMAALGFQLNR